MRRLILLLLALVPTAAVLFPGRHFQFLKLPFATVAPACFLLWAAACLILLLRLPRNPLRSAADLLLLAPAAWWVGERLFTPDLRATFGEVYVGSLAAVTVLAGALCVPLRFRRVGFHLWRAYLFVCLAVSALAVTEEVCYWFAPGVYNGLPWLGPRTNFYDGRQFVRAIVRVQGAFLYPNDLAKFLLPGLLILLPRLGRGRWPGLVLMGSAFVLTFSRSAFLALGLGVALLLVTRPRMRRRLWRWPVVVAGAVMAPFVVWRLSSLLVFSDRSLTRRVSNLEAAWNHFRLNPPGQFDLFTPPVRFGSTWSGMGHSMGLHFVAVLAAGLVAFGVWSLLPRARRRAPVPLAALCLGAALIPDINHSQAVLHLFLALWAFGWSGMSAPVGGGGG